MSPRRPPPKAYGVALFTLLPVPEDEPERLASLRSLAILDTPRETRYDRITKLAAGYLQVPVAFVCLGEEERQWFKSIVGFDACSAMPCAGSFYRR